MGTEKFNYVKPSVANGDNVALVSQAWGDPVTSKMRSEAAPRGDVREAGLFSTAPYRPNGLGPRPDRAPEREGHCTAKGDTCMAYATKKYPGLCVFHGRN